ncbi:Os08g0315200 [Oryza sativa Japonica Group]|uniref:Os08g0315200 protein n=3 Tax=Oryza sativa subsp. japonica TaxID=39947 RepID=A0A0P0XEK5_ORYSJ|nr:Os08g0315200 [Oryza sativa Japonica Group]BAT04856.1 Os08g0315200 [Oryza sativa Japonica Group]|eukprot:NP_001061517.1 Os08g0315200 [Oryza sativa Japonica Group]
MTRPSTRSQSHDAPEGSRSRGDEPPPPPTMAEVLMAVERNREAENAVLQQIAASAAATATHIAQGAGGGGHHAAGGLAEFQRTQPPVFTRSDDPLDADDWLRTIERKLTLIRCPDAEKTNLAAEQLQAAAGDWWENFLAMQPDGRVVTWAQFRDAFRAAHVPKGIMDLKQCEFLSLTQGNKSVMEYLCEFNHLARYAPDDVKTDTRKQNRFMNGLSAEMQLELAAHSFLDFQDLVNRSVVVESKMKNLEAERKRKKAAQISAAGGSQKPRGWQPPPPRFQAPPPPRPQRFVPRPP